MAKYKIKSPNAQYSGVSASVAFSKGEAETDSDYLAEWFKGHGYEVTETKEAKEPKEPKAKEAKE